MNRFQKFVHKCFGTDRRRAARYDLPPLASVTLTSGDFELRGVGLDLSETGTLLKSDYYLAQNTPVFVSVNLKPTEDVAGHNLTLEGSGVVVRVQKKLNGEYEIAVHLERLEQIKEDEASKLKTSVSILDSRR